MVAVVETVGGKSVAQPIDSSGKGYLSLAESVFVISRGLWVVAMAVASSSYTRGISP